MQNEKTNIRNAYAIKRIVKTLKQNKLDKLTLVFKLVAKLKPKKHD